MWWPGCKGSARMPLARFLALEVWMSWREGRLQPMIFSAERTMRCSLSLSLSLLVAEGSGNFYGIINLKG